MMSNVSVDFANAHRADLLRAAEHARLGASTTRRGGVLRRLVSRLYADAGSSDSPRRTYTLAPTDR
jgi:hypothetical protein